MNDMDAPATKQDVRNVVREAMDDAFKVLDTMMARIDDRFQDSEQRITKLQDDVSSINNNLDSMNKKLEISDDERLVMAYQLTKIQNWAERAGKRIGLKFEH